MGSSCSALQSSEGVPTATVEVPLRASSQVLDVDRMSIPFCLIVVLKVLSSFQIAKIHNIFLFYDILHFIPYS